MPFDPGPSMPIPDPQLRGLAAESDRALGEALAAVVPAPMKPYNAKVWRLKQKSIPNPSKRSTPTLYVFSAWSRRPPKTSASRSRFGSKKCATKRR
jgi:hypothetical protein